VPRRCTGPALPRHGVLRWSLNQTRRTQSLRGHYPVRTTATSHGSSGLCASSRSSRFAISFAFLRPNGIPPNSLNTHKPRLSLRSRIHPHDEVRRCGTQSFDRLSASLGNDFQAARTLVGMVESAATRMNELDRLQLGRLMVSSGHSITLTCRGPDHDKNRP
jgi:hypothetical protein